METIKYNKTTRQPKHKRTSGGPSEGKYASVEEASAAKMESAREFIANIDLTLFKKNGHVE